MRLSVVKPLSAKCIIKAVDEVSSLPCEIKIKKYLWNFRIYVALS